MKVVNIKKGLNLPIKGEPVPAVFNGSDVTQVALLGTDYPGLKPFFNVNIGDTVKLGQVLFTDKKNPSIRLTSPGSGRVSAIHRGERRMFLSIVIDLNGNNKAEFPQYNQNKLHLLKTDIIQSLLIESGLWTSLRSRPFGKIADPATRPHAIFITAIDTNPMAPYINKILEGQKEDFTYGVIVLEKLIEGKIYICQPPDIKIPCIDSSRVEPVIFSGPHPAGLPSTHIHFLDPVHRRKINWHIGIQDVIAIGKLFTTGQISTERIISLAGSMIKNPRMIRTRVGASVSDLTRDEIRPGNHRPISGSVLSGHKAENQTGFLGRYHQQVTVLPEQHNREFLGWLNPGWNLFSTKRILLSSLAPNKKFNFMTYMHGGKRTIVPSGGYEKVMPLDILPTYLLRALAVDDLDEAEKLGCLELVEEDLGLCTFICPSKIDHMANLRRNLNLIEKEG
ncbi:Na(+)-translocating NADH-quinone reductase subunit A [bacterium]|nr:Na(+)-translocating NADH-quinone reductase subunit A [bacterium]